MVGGRPVAVLMKYKARARIGAEASDQPFELDFLLAVGRALARDAALTTLDSIPGASSLGFSTVMSMEGAGRLSPRPAIRNLSAGRGFERLVQAELDLIPWTPETFERVVQLLTEDDPSIALVSNAISQEREQLEYTEVWELGGDRSYENLASAWSTTTEEWEPVVAATGLAWSGSEFAVLEGALAREALVILQPYSATSAVNRLFSKWYDDQDASAMTRALQIADEAVATMRATGRSETELGGELSGMLSRVGFLKSFDDALLGEAQEALQDAIRVGAADHWVTRWNLANVLMRSGEFATALELLDEIEADSWEWAGNAFVLFHLPGRSAIESLIRVDAAELNEFIAFQRAVAEAASARNGGIREVLERFRDSEAPVVLTILEWAKDE